MVDRRADVWAFGVVLYEMLAGRPAFVGDNISDVLAAVLKNEVVWTTLPVALFSITTPPTVLLLPEMTLNTPAMVPPTLLPVVPLISTPGPLLASAVLPAASRPM